MTTPRTRSALVFALGLGAAGLASTPALADTVFLKDGGRVRGVVMEEVPGKGVRVKLLDGTVREVASKDVDRVAYDGEVEPARKAPEPKAPAKPESTEGTESTSHGPATPVSEPTQAPGFDVVELHDGARILGTILSVTSRGVSVRLAGGTERRLASHEVRSVRYAERPGAERPLARDGREAAAPAYAPSSWSEPPAPTTRRRSMPMAIAGLIAMPVGAAGLGGFAYAYVGDLGGVRSGVGNSGRDLFAVGMGVSGAVLVAGAVLAGLGLRKVPAPDVARGFDPTRLELRF